jgi:hypothetical protein
MSTEHDKLVEDCARAIDRFVLGSQGWSDKEISSMTAPSSRGLEVARAAVAIAVERCAKVAESEKTTPCLDGLDYVYNGACHDVAAAIRALVSPNKQDGA